MYEAGDIVWVDFDPAFGHEQAGRRPALIISDREYNELSSFILVCPITRSPKQSPFKIPLTAGSVAGQILVDQIKSVDKRRVVSSRLEAVEAGVMSEVRRIFETLFGIDDEKA